MPIQRKVSTRFRKGRKECAKMKKKKKEIKTNVKNIICIKENMLLLPNEVQFLIFQMALMNHMIMWKGNHTENFWNAINFIQYGKKLCDWNTLLNRNEYFLTFDEIYLHQRRYSIENCVYWFGGIDKSTPHKQILTVCDKYIRRMKGKFLKDEYKKLVAVDIRSSDLDSIRDLDLLQRETYYCQEACQVKWNIMKNLDGKKESVRSHYKYWFHLDCRCYDCDSVRMCASRTKKYHHKTITNLENKKWKKSHQRGNDKRWMDSSVYKETNGGNHTLPYNYDFNTYIANLDLLLKSETPIEEQIYYLEQLLVMQKPVRLSLNKYNEYYNFDKYFKHSDKYNKYKRWYEF